MLHQAPQTPRPRPPNFSRSRSSNNNPSQAGHTRKQSSLSLLSNSATPKGSKSGSITTTSLLLGRVDGGEEEDGTTSSSRTEPLSLLPSPTKRSSLTGKKMQIPFPASSNQTQTTPSHLLPPPPYPTSPPPPPLPASTTDQAAQLQEPPTPTTAAAQLLGFLHDGAGEGTVAGEGVGVVGLVGATGGGGGGESPMISEEWVKERSREELDRLLIEADRVIREREKELGIAAAIGKSLLENNIALRNKHESLLAAFPLHSPHPPSSHSHSQRRTPRPSLSNAPSWLTDNGDDEQAARDAEEREEGFSPSRTPTNLYGRASAARMSRGASSGGGSGDQGWVFGRPSSRSSMGSNASASTSTSNANTISPPRSKRVHTLSFSSSPTSSCHRPRAPSLSASPQAILYLREQNNDLAIQLEQLQAETSDADHEGKKKLRKLEKEIGALRGNLERMNERNGELEERNGELEEKVSKRGGSGGGEGGGGGGRGAGDGGWAERRRLKREEEEAERNRRAYGGLLVGSNSTPLLGRHGSGAGRRTPSPTAHLQQLPQQPHSFASSPRSSSPGSSQSTLSPPASPRTRSISLLGPSLSALSSPLRNSTSVNSTSTTTAADATRPRTAAELALVSQLLGKIRELEQANEEMRIKREAMDKRISRAKREGAELEGVYEVLEGEVERAGLEVVDVSDNERVRRPDSSMEMGLSPLPQPRTPSRQTGAAGRKSLDRSNRSTPNKSPSTAAIELDFFSTSPSSVSNLTSSFASSSSPSSLHLSTSWPSSSSTPHRRVAQHQQQRLSPNRNLPPSPSSVSVTSTNDGSARFRSATGNRLMIETNKLRKKISSSNFLSPDSPAPAPLPAVGAGRQRHLRASMTPSPTAIHLRGGSPLKLRVDVRGEEEESEESASPSKGRSRRPSRSWEEEASEAAAAAASRGGGEYEDEEEEEEEEQFSSGRGDHRAELTPRRKREIRLAAMPSLRSLGSWGKGSTRSRAGGRAGGQTLGSELGSQYASFFNQPSAEERDWEDDDDRSAYSSSDDDDGGQSVYLPSTSLIQHINPAELALRSVHLALTPTEDGLYLDTSTPILPPGSLTISPPADSHTFDLLDQAVNQRPIRWADDDDDLYGTSERLEPATTRASSSIWDFAPSLLPKQVTDPFETTLYPEPDFPPASEHEERLRFRSNRIREAVEAGEDPLSKDVLRPPTRRELALQRMGLEPGASSPFGTSRPFDEEEEEEEEEEDFLLVEGERGGFGGRRLLSAPTDGPSDWLARLRPGNVIDRVGRKWVQGLLDFWFFLQLIVVAMVFMKEAMKMGRKPRRAALGQQQQRRIA